MHAWYLECHGDPGEKVPPDAGTRRVFETGLAWERACFASLDGAVEVPWDGAHWAAGQAATEALMRRGVPWIYQPVLVAGDLRGRPDLLRRLDEPSALGTFAYEPVDVKSHKKVSAKDRVQLRVSARLLEPVLGRAPAHGGIWLSTDKIARVDLSEHAGDLLDRMRAVRDGRARTDGVRCDECQACPWVDHCSREWEAGRHATLVRGATGNLARKLLRAGLRTFDDVERRSPRHLAARLKLRPDLAVRLHRGARAWVLGRPVPLRPPRWPDAPAAHFYDIETLGETVYLHGLLTLDGAGRTIERQTLARTREDERRAWHELLDIVAALPEGPIYAWSNFEAGHVQRLRSRHEGGAAGYRRLTRDLVDLCAFVRTHFALLTSGYGIKEVAPLFGFSWQAKDAGGLAAGTWYQDWLAGGDDALRRKVCEYNLDDVRPMLAVYRGLRD
jgi:uncharacterized protein